MYAVQEEESFITLPGHLSVEIRDGEQEKAMTDAIQFTFGDITEQSSSTGWINIVSARAILATTNNYVDDINKQCLNQLNGEEIVLPSVDSTTDPNDGVHYPVEYINTLNLSRIPAHRLTLKKGAVVMLLRNLNISGGLCNGTRLIIEDVINNRLIRAIIANGENKGKTVLIPKILTQPTDSHQYGFEWQRVQFPVRLAFAMTIHKSQGQTLDKVAVWLQDPCFGHGQLYVATSRVGNPDHIKFFVKSKAGHRTFTTRNVVYFEFLQ